MARQLRFFFLFSIVCFQGQHMKHLPKNCTKHSKITSALPNQNCHGVTSQFVIMLVMWVWLLSYPNFMLFWSFRVRHNKCNVYLQNKSYLTIVSYNFQVTYQTELFLDKNKDYVVAEHQALLNASMCSFVSGLFPPLAEDSSKTSKFSSIGSRFKVCCFTFHLRY